MKKYIQIFVVLVLVLTVIGIARNSPAWASGQPSGAARPLSEIDVTESGTYTVGGLCEFNAVYTGSGASAKLAVDVPADVSRKVPYSYKDQLYLAGCHIVHSVMDVVTAEMSPTYGSWEVCFGDRPDEQLTIYYYPDDGSADWQPLTTTVKDGFACAPAIYTGVYAPGGRRLNTDTATDAGTQQDTFTGGGGGVGSPGGTVKPPSLPVLGGGTGGRITESGTYNIGGLCSLIVDYHIPDLSNEVHVEENVEISANVPFPDNQGLLYLPGCHVFHFKENNLRTDTNVNADEGKWKICFAAVPNKETTIFFYYAKDETPGSALPDWAPLETTIENGMACAPATDHTGVYAPVGK
jgi:hypothetical protein